MIIGVISTDEAAGGIKYYFPLVVCIETWEKPGNCDNNMDMLSNDGDDDYGHVKSWLDFKKFLHLFL